MSSTGPSTAESAGSAGVVGFDGAKYEPPHRPNKLDLALVGGVIVNAVEMERKLGADDFRDGAALCAGVL
jgi:hypothetical protein